LDKYYENEFARETWNFSTVSLIWKVLKIKMDIPFQISFFFSKKSEILILGNDL